jgi:parallel beta helix pectate lyase-like protein
MSRSAVFCVALAAFGSTVVCSVDASAATDCQFSVRRQTMTLQGDCTTDTTILVPDGFTLRGRDFTITAVDPVGAHFLGAVVRNAGAEAHVRNLHVTTSNLTEACHVGEDQLAGIELNGASGSLIANVVSNVNQAGGHGGCQEGNGIVAASAGATVRVTIEGNAVDAYQKNGIKITGNVRATVRANAVTGFGPVDTIAQNGIRIEFGADATVEANVVSGNSYSGTAGGVQASGVLVVGGPNFTGCAVSPCPFTTDLRIARNVLLQNDVGVLLNNSANPAGAAPATPTDNLIENNAIFKSSLTNGSATQVGIFDIGNRDRIIGNTVGGAGYDPAANPGAFTERIFAEPPFALNPVVRRNRLLP